jgi:RNA polymerase sigma-70 factor (TIGR02960 family)
MMTQSRATDEGAAALTAMRANDQRAFSAATLPYHKELRLHCYRMLGSFDESEDLVQETFLRAWRGRQTFEGRASLRAWLYGIATHACLDVLGKKPREPNAAGEVLWLQPFPDRLMDAPAPPSERPDAAVFARETIGLAFLVAIQFLPAKQRAALILCDVLDWSAKEAAELLDLSVASLNSALQRARATMRERRPALGPEWRPGGDPDEQQRQLLERIVSTTESGDVAGLAQTLRDDVRFSMPPEPGTWTGRDAVVGSWVQGGFGTEAFGQFRCLITSANRQPAVAGYIRKPGETKFLPLALDVLQIEDGLVKEIFTFALAGRVQEFGLPAEL